ncbi:MAG: class II fructose-bisphosphate aldolase [Deinococcota bacterium]
MPLVPGLDILKPARDGKYGVGAFNTDNMEITQAVLEAAEETSSPVFLALSEGAVSYGKSQLVDMVIHEAKQAHVPVAVHLDHGSSYEICLKCLRWGFTSVMIDKSHEDEAQNTVETKRVVEAAHAVGISVEAEIGRLGGIEENIVVSEDEAALTSPDEAARFVQNTGADYLAIAVGTSHGPNKGIGRPFIHHQRIAEIAERVPNPLVMHGASGIPQDLVQRFNAVGGDLKDAFGIHDEDIHKAVSHGMTKVNVGTDLRIAATTAVRENLKDNPTLIDLRKLLGPARNEMKRIIKKRINILKGNTTE